MVRVTILCLAIIETTHTPQGDENSPEAAALPLSPETTYTPQGDGNTAIFSVMPSVV